MPESHDPIFRIREDVTSREMEGEAYIMDLRSLKTYALNSTAAFVWSLVDGRRSREDICRAVLEQYDITPDICRDEIGKLLALLESEQLILTAGPDA